MDAITALTTRRSIRKYEAIPLKKEDLDTILDCGRLAPCGTNRQGWRFVCVTEPALLQQIASVTTYGKHIAQAGACIVILIGPDSMTKEQDAASAAACMAVAARALGLGSCWVGTPGSNHFDEIAKMLGAPEDFKIHCLLSVGVPHGPQTPAVKKALSEVSSYNQF